MRLRLSVMAALLAAPPLLAAHGTERPTDPAALLRAWAEAYATNEGPRAAALYTEQARLWGSTSREQSLGRDEIARYFGRVRPGATAIAVRFGEYGVQEAPGGFAAVSGHYTFVRVQPDRSEQLEPSRFSMAMLRGPDGVWRILDHHSSRLPGR